MGLAARRGKTSCFCHEGCGEGTYPFMRYWVSSFAPFDPFEPARRLFIFKSDTDGECLWEALNPGVPPLGYYRMRKQTLVIGPDIVGWRLTVEYFDTTGLNAWQDDFFPPVNDTGLVQPEWVGSCSRMKYTLPNVVWGAGWTAVIEPAYPDACDDNDFITKVQTKVIAPY